MLDLIIILARFVYLEGFVIILLSDIKLRLIFHKNNKNRIDYLRTKDQCYITGWGYTGTDYLATFSDVVKRANVKLTPFSQCKDAYRIHFQIIGGYLIMIRPSCGQKRP